MDHFAELFDLSRFMPHGMCYLWKPELLILHVGSDFLIAAAYFSIPAAMIIFLRHRPEASGAIFKLFVAFILLCGITHLASIVVVWYPAYVVEGLLKFATAAVSVVTAISLWPLLPRAISVPSREEVEDRNREIEALNRDLQRRVDSLSTLAGGVSHEFNNLLTVIKGHAQLLKDEVDSAEQVEDLEAINDAADRATHVCRQMLAFSGRGHFLLEKLDVNDLINRLDLPADPRCNLTYSLSNAVEPINASPEQVRQLVTDLCTNAMEAIRESSRDRGEVGIATYRATLTDDDLDRAAFEHDLAPGKVTIIEVTDNGTGMSTQLVERIFEPYYSTKFAGRGLGLAAAQGIVRGHGGCMFIDSEPGRGTTVKVAFPIDSTTAIEAERAKRQLRTVLVIDDEPGILSLARKYLSQLNVKVFTTSDPDEALRLARRYGPELDAVILDYLMPRVTGSELAREIAEVTDADIYMMSGYSRGEIDDPTTRKLMTGFISKPFSRRDFETLFA